MQIRGVEGLTHEQLQSEIARGGRFVLFQYCISVLILTFRRSSDIYFLRVGESATRHSIRFTILSLIAGWWGLPWGPIYTVGALATNLGGGKDVTDEVLQSI
jgi:hypothetical protein